MKNKKDITSLAIGTFDGMHLAHQELFKRLDENGAILSIESGNANITPYDYRQEYSLFPLFSYDLIKIKNFSGEEFINLLKKDFPKLKTIVVGFDFCFGKNRKSNTDELKKIFPGKVIVINEIKIDNTPVHSSKIRELIKGSNIKEANKFLGKEYKIYGEQIKGQGLGSKNFVPTINLLVKGFLLPSEGVYITKTSIDNIEYESVSFIGKRMSTDGEFAVETHILEKEIENKNYEIQIKFIDKIRNNKKFDNFEELKSQILLDINFAREFFKKKNR